MTAKTTEPTFKHPTLGAALSAAQSEISTAAKNASNPHFGSRFADLTAVWDACREPLTKHGLSVIQIPGNDGERVTLTTILMHESGETVSGTVGVVPSKRDAQALGSVLTYLRRYALSAFVGVAQADDDGNAGSGRHDDRRGRGDDPPDKPELESDPDHAISEANFRALWFAKLGDTKLDLSDKDRHDLQRALWGVESIKDLTADMRAKHATKIRETDTETLKGLAFRHCPDLTPF